MVSTPSVPRSFVRRACLLACVSMLTVPALAATGENAAVISQVMNRGRGGVVPDTTIGWHFELTREVEVTGLGFFDMLETDDGSVGDGLFGSHRVGIWTEDGTLLVSGTVAAGDAAPLVGDFRTVAVDPIRLLPNTTYLIGAHYPSSCSFSGGHTGDCQVRYVAASFTQPAKFKYSPVVRPGGVWRLAPGFAAPLAVSGGFREAFGANFSFTVIGAPPEQPDPPAGLSVLEDPLDDVVYFEGPLPEEGPVAPDIARVTAGFDEDDLIVTVSFAAGTMQPGVEGLFYVLGLDVDVNVATGGSFIPGAEKILFFATDLTFATICDEFVSLATCHNQLPVTALGDRLEVAIPLDDSGIDDDGVALFGFVAGLFVAGVPATEDDAFDGVSRSLERNLSALTGSLLGTPVPEPSGTLLGCSMLIAMSWLASRRREMI